MIPFPFFKNEIRREHEIRLYVRKDMEYGTQKSCGMGNVMKTCQI